MHLLKNILIGYIFFRNEKLYAFRESLIAFALISFGSLKFRGIILLKERR